MIENKMYLLAVDLIKKRYPKGWGETADDAIIRELKEETGIAYDANNLKELLLLEYYQPNYPTRRDEVINRLIRTKFYFGQYRGIDLKSINRTENEVKDNFHLDLIDLDEFASLINESSENSRKKYFDRENQEVIKVLKKLKIKGVDPNE